MLCLGGSCSLAANTSAQAKGVNPYADETLNQVQQAVNDGLTSTVQTLLGVPVRSD